ncbi:aspartate aminotransferase family protein, partial [Georgenia sp. 10Sc9-8]|nr:aspartate aminotransferase family protein [Georgenia halotolerans]
MENARVQGERMGRGLAELAQRHPVIGDIRGRGLFYGIELVKNRETRAPLVPFGATPAQAAPMNAVTSAAWERGLF